MIEKETKTLAFNVSDLERFKDYFPDFRSGKMTGRELGSKLLEVLENQASTNSTQNSQVDENAFNALKVDYQELQEKFRSLENAFQKQTQDKDNLMLEASDNKRLQEQIQELSIEKDELLKSLNSFKIDNQRLQEIQIMHMMEVLYSGQCQLVEQYHLIMDIDFIRFIKHTDYIVV